LDLVIETVKEAARMSEFEYPIMCSYAWEVQLKPALGYQPLDAATL